jgi:cytochrome c2
MSKFLKFTASIVLLGTALATNANAQDADAGEKVFRKCAACHAVGEGAKNKVGPELNEIFGRVAGSHEDFKYSKAMVKAGDEGLVWDHDSLTEYLAKPRAFVKGTRMAFAGLKKDDEIANVIAYLATFSSSAEQAAAEPEPAPTAASGGDTAPVETAEAPAANAADAVIPEHGVYHLGREALPEEVAAWDIDVRPDGVGLPVGSGTVADGGVLYDDNCAVCHGVFGEGEGRWPVLSGGFGTLTADRPVKTIGSYWPFASTIFDYVHRAMPFGNARSLDADQTYAITAYLLYLNDIVTDEDFELSNETFSEISLPNEENFYPDDRLDEANFDTNVEPCMENCGDGPAEIVMRARILDVTPDGDDESGAGGID